MAPFIPKLADQTAPLRALTKKDVPFEWNSSLQKVFENVKASICKDIALTYFDVTKPTTIQVDTLKIGIGSALLQDGRLIAFASKALTETEQWYTNIKRELLAVNTSPHTSTENPLWLRLTTKNLEMIHKKSLASTPPHLQRMLLRLQHYEVSIKYCPGKEMVLMDSLSYLSPIPDKEIHLEQSIYAVQFTNDKLQQLKLVSESDPEVTAIKNNIIDGWPDSAKELPPNWILVMQGWAFSRRWTCTERRAHADSHYHEELCSAKHPRRTPRNGEVQATCQDVRVLERHQCGYWVYCEDVLSMPDQPEQSAGIDTPNTWHSGWFMASASHRHLPPWWKWLRHCCWQLFKDVLLSTSQIHFHQRHSNLSSEAAVWRARHTTQTALYNGPQYDRRIQDICSRLWIQTCHKLTQIPQSNGFAECMVQTVKKTMLKARQSSTDPDLSLLCLCTTPIDNNLPSSAKLLYSWQLRSILPLLSSHTPQDTAVHKNLQARQWMQKNYHNQSTLTFYHSTLANMSICQKPAGPGYQPLLLRRGLNCVHTPFALQTVVSTVIIITSYRTWQHHPNVSHGQTRPALTSTSHPHWTSNNR